LFLFLFFIASLLIFFSFFFFFNLSLSATILRRRIIGAMHTKETQKAAKLIDQVTIYNNPTIDKLAAFISGAVTDPEHFALTTNKTEIIEAMIEKYSAGLSAPISVNGRSGPPSHDAVVLLTGSTGNLGAQLLESLLRDPRVKRVYVLNRPSSGSKSVQDRQAERFVDKAFDTSLLASERLVFLEGDALQKNLGLSDNVYDEVGFASGLSWSISHQFSVDSQRSDNNNS
jgi:hypothetical protein